MVGIDIVETLTRPVDIIQRNPGILVPALLPAVISLLFAVVFAGGMMAGIGGFGPGMMGPSAAMNPLGIQGFFGIFAVFMVVLVLASLIAQGAIVSIAYSELKGIGVEYMQGINDAISKLAPLVVAAIVIAVLVGIGFMLLVIPGLIVGLLLMFAVQEIMISGKSAPDALSGSYNLVKANFGNVLIYAIVLLIISGVASAIIGIIPFIGNAISTILVTPYVAISLTMAYMQLTEPSAQAKPSPDVH